MNHQALTAWQWGASALIHLSVLGLLALLVRSIPTQDAYVPLNLSISWAAPPAARPEPLERAVDPKERRAPEVTPAPSIEQPPVIDKLKPVIEPSASVAEGPAPAIPEEDPLATANAPQPAAPSIAAQPEPYQEPDPVPPEPVIAARFDAAYLNNPAPVYPLLSRRLREEGKVLLRVQVSAQGRAEHLYVKKSSGYRRLDEAAQQAVSQWRFIPARQGAEPVTSDVTVPIVFRLQDARADNGGYAHEYNNTVFA
jgi:protein TonB